MNDDILNSGLLSMMITVAVAVAASVSLAGPGPAADAASAIEMPVVMLPAVEVAGKRLAPEHDTAAVATPGPSVVQLPLVAVTGRRVPGMETVIVAQHAND